MTVGLNWKSGQPMLVLRQAGNKSTMFALVYNVVLHCTHIIYLVHHSLESRENSSQEQTPEGQRRLQVVPQRQQMLRRIGARDDDCIVSTAVGVVATTRFGLSNYHRIIIFQNLCCVFIETDLLVDRLITRD